MKIQFLFTLAAFVSGYEFKNAANNMGQTLTKDSAFSQFTTPGAANYNGFSGSVADIAISNDGNRAWAVAVNSGLWHTRNFGDDEPIWHQVSMHYTVSLSCVAIEEDPDTGSTYIAVGSGLISTNFDNSFVGEIMRSMDGGSTWEKITVDGHARPVFSSIVITNQGQTILGASNQWPQTSDAKWSGIWMSEKGQPAIHLQLPALSGEALHIVKSKFANKVYALFNDGRIAYTSSGFRDEYFSNQAVLFVTPEPGLPTGVLYTRGQLTFQYLKSNPKTDTGTLLGFITDIGGQYARGILVETFEDNKAFSMLFDVPAYTFIGQGQFHGTITACDTQLNYVYISGTFVQKKPYVGNVLNIHYYQINYPAFYQRKYSNRNFIAHPDSKAARTLANGDVVFCTDGGCFRSRNPMANEFEVDWKSVASNMGNIECTSGGFDPVTGSAACCAQDNGCLTYISSGNPNNESYRPAQGPAENWADHLGDGATAAVFPGAGPNGGPGILVSHQYLYNMRQTYPNMTKTGEDLPGCGGNNNGFEMIPNVIYNYFNNAVMVKCSSNGLSSVMIYQFIDGVAQARPWSIDGEATIGKVAQYGHPKNPNALYIFMLFSDQKIGNYVSVVKIDVSDAEVPYKKYDTVKSVKWPSTLCVHPTDDSHIIFGKDQHLFSMSDAVGSTEHALGSFDLSDMGTQTLTLYDCQWHQLGTDGDLADRYVVHLSTNGGLFFGETIFDESLMVYDVPHFVPARFGLGGYYGTEMRPNSFIHTSAYFPDHDMLTVVSQGQGVSFLPRAHEGIVKVLEFKITAMALVQSRRQIRNRRGEMRATDLTPLKLVFSEDVALSNDTRIKMYNYITEDMTPIENDRITADANNLTISLDDFNVPLNTMLAFVTSIGDIMTKADNTVYFSGVHHEDEPRLGKDIAILGGIVYFSEDNAPPETQPISPTWVDNIQSTPNSLTVKWWVDNTNSCVFKQWKIMIGNGQSEPTPIGTRTAANLHDPNLREAHVTGLDYRYTYVMHVSQECITQNLSSEPTSSNGTMPRSPPAEAPKLYYYLGRGDNGKDIMATTATFVVGPQKLYGCKNPMVHLVLVKMEDGNAVTFVPTGGDPQPRGDTQNNFMLSELKPATTYTPKAMVSCDDPALNSSYGMNWDMGYFTTLSEKCSSNCGFHGECVNGMCSDKCDMPVDPCCSTNAAPNCGVQGNSGAACVCEFDPFCCDKTWDLQCVKELQQACQVQC